jgi:hypothetical protein
MRKNESKFYIIPLFWDLNSAVTIYILSDTATQTSVTISDSKYINYVSAVHKLLCEHYLGLLEAFF